MAKSEPKTKATIIPPRQFIAAMEDGTRKRDAEMLLPWMERVTGLKAKMWGASIIGFGRYAYTYDSGHSGESCMAGFSPRKANMVIYTMQGYKGFEDQLARLGKHKTGQSCLYLGPLSGIDLDVLEEIVAGGFAYMRKTYQTWDE